MTYLPTDDMSCARSSRTRFARAARHALSCFESSVVPLLRSHVGYVSPRGMADEWAICCTIPASTNRCHVASRSGPSVSSKSTTLSTLARWRALSRSRIGTGRHVGRVWANATVRPRVVMAHLTLTAANATDVQTA